MKHLRVIDLRSDPDPTIDRGFDDCTHDEFVAALAADFDAKCSQCDHTKGQHYSAGPRCMVCDCRRFLVRTAPGDEVSSS